MAGRIRPARGSTGRMDRDDSLREAVGHRAAVARARRAAGPRAGDQRRGPRRAAGLRKNGNPSHAVTRRGRRGRRRAVGRRAGRRGSSSSRATVVISAAFRAWSSSHRRRRAQGKATLGPGVHPAPARARLEGRSTPLQSSFRASRSRRIHNLLATRLRWRRSARRSSGRSVSGRCRADAGARGAGTGNGGRRKPYAPFRPLVYPAIASGSELFPRPSFPPMALPRRLWEARSPGKRRRTWGRGAGGAGSGGGPGSSVQNGADDPDVTRW